MVKIYKQPFAHDGDTIAIPDASQPDGKMSSADGWTPDYQLPKTDPNYKPVGRQEMNGVFKEVTEALGEIQQFGFAKWQAITWPQGARVVEGGVVYRALKQTSQKPPHADWKLELGTAASRDVGTGSGNVMEVGEFGLGRRVSVDGAIWNEADKRSGFFRLPPDSAENPFGDTSAASISWSGYGDGGHLDRLITRWTGERYFFQHFDGTEWGETREIIHTGNITTTTGQSTKFPMTQKAVTDAINNTAIGVGQTWEVASLSNDVTYTNTTGRTIVIVISTFDTYTPEGRFYVDGVVVARQDGISGQKLGSSDTVLVPPGSTYRFTGYTGFSVAALR